MYRICVRKDFIAQHFLIGGDWGYENSPHSHHFILELELAAADLDQHGYVFDIALVKEQLDLVISDFRDQLLNDRPEFAGLNPSLEHFCRILAERLADSIKLKTNQFLRVRLWEDHEAWASYEMNAESCSSQAHY